MLSVQNIMLVVALVGLAACHVTAAPPANYLTELLLDAAIPSDDASLIQHLNRHSILERAATKNNRETDIATLISLLSSKSFEARENASKELIRRGTNVLNQLERELPSASGETKVRLQAIVREIRNRNSERMKAADSAAIQILAERRSPLAVDCMIENTRFFDEAVQDRMLLAMDRIIDAPNSAVIRCLDSEDEATRAAAGYLCARYGDKVLRQRAVELLRDASALVRLRVAQALITIEPRRAIQTLIELFNPAVVQSIAWQAEELLVWASNQRGPTFRIGLDDGLVRLFCQHAWQRWIDAPSSGVEEAVGRASRGEPPMLLIVQQFPFGYRMIGSDDTSRLHQRNPYAKFVALTRRTIDHLIGAAYTNGSVIEQSSSRKSRFESFDLTVRRIKTVAMRNRPGDIDLVPLMSYSRSDGVVLLVNRMYCDSSHTDGTTSRMRLHAAELGANEFIEPQWFSDGRLCCCVRTMRTSDRDAVAWIEFSADTFKVVHFHRFGPVRSGGFEWLPMGKVLWTAGFENGRRPKMQTIYGRTGEPERQVPNPSFVKDDSPASIGQFRRRLTELDSVVEQYSDCALNAGERHFTVVFPVLGLGHQRRER